MNTLCSELVSGTLGELLVQTRLLQYGVQAAPPLKDSGNDLVAVRGSAIRTIQVKTTDKNFYRPPDGRKRYHILAAVRLVGEKRNVLLDGSEVFLIRKSELAGRSRQFSEVGSMKLTAMRINALFPPGRTRNSRAKPS